MYPWHARLSSWTESLNFKIDALGLLTLLGADEMDTIIGRLVLNPYLDYLPLLGGFVISGNQFTRRKTGFVMYNLSVGIKTNEFAGWFSRWLQTQDFYQVRSIVTWDETERRPPRWKAFFIGILLISVSCNGILVALTVLAADWWGFANTMSMIALIVVKCVLVAQNQAGIDANIKQAKKEQAKTGAANTRDMAKIVVITDDSKAVTISAPAYLIRNVFTAHPKIPNPRLYTAMRAIAWVAYAVHVICIGMAALYTQIVTVVIIITATVLTANKVGCEDSHLWRDIKSKLRFSLLKEDENDIDACWVSSTLKATISSYPAEYTDWDEKTQQPAKKVAATTAVADSSLTIQIPNKRRGFWHGTRTISDIETPNVITTKKVVPERRQDLYAWLLLSPKEDSCLEAWGMTPHNEKWMEVYFKKKEIHRRRIERANLEDTK